MTGLIELIEDDELKTGWPLLSIKQLIAYSILVMHLFFVHYCVRLDQSICEFFINTIIAQYMRVDTNSCD